LRGEAVFFSEALCESSAMSYFFLAALLVKKQTTASSRVFGQLFTHRSKLCWTCKFVL